MKDFDLSITICSWNTVEDLRICLDSLQKIRDEASFEVIVVDNNSEDGSPVMVEQEFPWVNLQKMTQNLGFVGGQNYAAENRHGRHVLPLNSDTIVHPGAIRGLLDYLESNPEVGVVAPKLLNPDGSLQYSCRRFPNPVAALFRNTLLGRLFPNNRFTKDYLMQDWSHDAPREVDWVSGAAFLARDTLVAEIGLFDPEYVMFCEDVDFCFQTWRHGKKVIYLPEFQITHAIGRSTDKAPNRMIGRFHRSMFRFYRKNIVPQQSLVVRPFSLALAATALSARASLFILRNKIDIVKRKLSR
ncbi:MAG: glycosyltransferase [Armatimonadetes bacterium]|nr:glycosyltransferase [Armatimonadota bacterium]MBS1725640.1 glycosyltransferase family 2 protein [Armatimonadota bacterium]